MSYMLLIMEPTGQRATRTPVEGEHVYERMVQFAGELKKRWVLKGVESLKAEGVRVETRAGKRALLDGPFAEAKELVGGFFLLDCASRQEAIDIAAQCPAAEWATVEVRETGPCYT